MFAFDEVYIASVMRTQGSLFFIVRDKLPGVDEKQFIERYMRSRIRAMLDTGNPKYVNMPTRELLRRFVEDECEGNYDKGEEWGGFISEWAGKVYALYQWKYNIKSKDLIEVLPLSEMERVFPALHQLGWEAITDKLHEILYY